MASVAVVAEASVLEAVVVAFGGADDVSVLTFPQPVTQGSYRSCYICSFHCGVLLLLFLLSLYHIFFSV